MDDPNGFDCCKGTHSANFQRTIGKYGDVEEGCCLVVQLYDRTLDLQFDNQETRDLVFGAIKAFLPPEVPTDGLLVKNPDALSAVVKMVWEQDSPMKSSYTKAFFEKKDGCMP